MDYKKIIPHQSVDTWRNINLIFKILGNVRVSFFRLKDNFFFRIITLLKLNKLLSIRYIFLFTRRKYWYILITTESKTCSYDKAHCYCLFHREVYGYLQAILVHLQFGIMTYTQHCPIISIWAFQDTWLQTSWEKWTHAQSSL